MLLLVQLITEVLQYVVTVTPVFFHFDKHFQNHLFSEETFDILPGHSTYFLQCLPLMPDDNPFLGITLHDDQRLDMDQLIILLEQLDDHFYRVRYFLLLL